MTRQLSPLTFTSFSFEIFVTRVSVGPGISTLS
jgi:hypothetical protein